MTKTLSQVELEKKTLAKWHRSRMQISSVSDMELMFKIYIIVHNIYNSNRLNSVSCEAMELAYKVVKNNLSVDLVQLLLNQFNKNMEIIRTSKKNPCNFVSLLTCLFFNVLKLFPSKGSVVWRKDVSVLY